MPSFPASDSRYKKQPLYIMKAFNRVPCYLVEFNPFSSPDNLGVCPGLLWPPWMVENKKKKYKNN